MAQFKTFNNSWVGSEKFVHAYGGSEYAYGMACMNMRLCVCIWNNELCVSVCM